MTNLIFEPTNQTQIKTLEPALVAHATSKGEILGKGSVQDLLADLMHYCATKDINLENMFSVAAGHYEVETEDV